MPFPACSGRADRCTLGVKKCSRPLWRWSTIPNAFPLLQLHLLPKWPLVFFRIVRGAWDHLTASTLPGIGTSPCPREGNKWHTNTCWIFHTVNLFTQACAVLPGWSLEVLCIGYALNIHFSIWMWFFYGVIAILSTAGWSEVPAVLSSSTPLVS